MNKSILVLGGFGFLGYCSTKTLLENNYNVRIIDCYSNDIYKNNNIDITIGDIKDKNILSKALKGVDTVLYFISQSFVENSTAALQFEIENTLSYLDYTLSIMKNEGVKNIIFPSSGGTVYGEIENINAKENIELSPCCSYGAGKALSETIIKYYCNTYNFNAIVLRISNVYGCPFYRKVPQGAIDIFIQKAIQDEVIELWGNPSLIIRDYIYIEDLCRAILSLISSNLHGFEVFNIATGIGHSLFDVIAYIEATLQRPLKKTILSNKYTGVKRNVLDITKIQEITGWIPKYTLENGIIKTIEKKLSLM